MQAMAYHAYGSPDNLELQEIEMPAPLSDQAALHGLLNGTRDLGLPLLSVHCVGPKTEKE